MNKSNHFSGQPTFSQLIRLIPKDIVGNCVYQVGSDHYYKKFNTWHHLVAMLFTCYGHCHSLREVVTGMRALEGRLQSSGINYFPARSTLAEANARRDHKVFELLYFELKAYWDRILPDSRPKKKPLYIIDSSTIKLFQEIFKGAGKSKQDGRRKGGLKVHMAVQDNQTLPSIMRITQAAYNDVTFTKHVELPAGSTLVMDRGYRDYKQYNLWTQQNIRWITRHHPNSYYKIQGKFALSSRQKKLGVLKDMRIRLGHPSEKIAKVKCRLIQYTSPITGKYFEFITNDFKTKPSVIASLYKKRWSIELLFRRLKQNMPLQYFLGDNQNAIQIQVWCALIADLLLQVVLSQVKKKWAFSNIVSIVRLHLFNYLNLFSFLEDPEHCNIQSTPPSDRQLELQLSG